MNSFETAFANELAKMIKEEMQACLDGLVSPQMDAESTQYQRGRYAALAQVLDMGQAAMKMLIAPEAAQTKKGVSR